LTRLNLVKKEGLQTLPFCIKIAYNLRFKEEYKMYTIIPLFPTHTHSSEFCEWLGRAVMTFGFLEEILKRSIFLYEYTNKYPENYSQSEFENYLEKLNNDMESMLSSTLGGRSGLIQRYKKCFEQRIDLTTPEEIIKDLDKYKEEWRNVLGHGSWGLPDEEGSSIPFFFKRGDKVKPGAKKFETPININDLKKVQLDIAQLAMYIANLASQQTGYKFPGAPSSFGKEFF
jgi:hypothetical protein